MKTSITGAMGATEWLLLITFAGNLNGGAKVLGERLEGIESAGRRLSA